MAIPSLALTQEGRMYWYTVLLIIGGLRLPKNSSSRLIDRLDITSIVLSGSKYIKQINTNLYHNHTHHVHVFYFTLLLEEHV